MRPEQDFYTFLLLLLFFQVCFYLMVTGLDAVTRHPGLSSIVPPSSWVSQAKHL